MATLSAGIQQYGTNIKNTNFVLTGSPLDTSGTTVFVLDSSGGYRSWKQGRASFLNNLSGTNKDEIPAYAAFQVLPGASITTDDTKLSFGTSFSGGGGTSLNSNWLM